MMNQKKSTSLVLEYCAESNRQAHMTFVSRQTEKLIFADFVCSKSNMMNQKKSASLVFEYCTQSNRENEVEQQQVYRIEISVGCPSNL